MEPRPFGTLALNAQEHAYKWGKLLKRPRTSAFQPSVPAWCLTQRLDVHYHSVAKDGRRVGNLRVILRESVGSTALFRSRAATAGRDPTTTLPTHAEAEGVWRRAPLGLLL